MGKIIRDGIVYAGSANKANQILYDNTSSGLEANSVQAALDILESKVGDGGGISLTQAEYDALSPEEQMNGTYYIYDVDEVITASDIIYDNKNSGLASDSVQNAIDELDHKIDNVTEINDATVSTEETWSSSKIQRTIENITVGGGEGSGSAITTSYDNSTSGLSAGSVQGAIDEIASEYLPLSGGTLDSHLKFNEGYAAVYAGSDGANLMHYPNPDDTANGLRLVVDGHSDLKYGLSLAERVNGAHNYYYLYGEHNKPTANDVGAATKEEVTTLTRSFTEYFPSNGNLLLANGMGLIEAGQNYIIIASYSEKSENVYYRYLGVRNSNISEKVNALSFVEKDANGTTTYMLYGQHNKPSGSYQGNGSATQRIINIGGIGKYLIIRNSQFTGIAHSLGMDYTTTDGINGRIPASEIKYVENGDLIISSTNVYVNANSGSYFWDVV